MSTGEADALARYMLDAVGHVVVYASAPTSVGRHEDEKPLLRFWADYSEIDRQRILASLNALACAPVTCSDPMVNVIRWTRGDEQILHLINYNYDAATDEVKSARGLSLRLPVAAGRGVTCTLLRPGREERLECRSQDGQLVIQVAELDCYGLVLVQ